MHAVREQCEEDEDAIDTIVLNTVDGYNVYSRSGLSFDTNHTATTSEVLKATACDVYKATTCDVREVESECTAAWISSWSMSTQIKTEHLELPEQPITINQRQSLVSQTKVTFARIWPIVKQETFDVSECMLVYQECLRRYIKIILTDLRDDPLYHSDEQPLVYGKRILLSRVGQLRQYSCAVCGKTFNRAATMKKHARVHFETNIKGVRYTCPVCQAIFMTYANVLKHIKVLHHLNDDELHHLRYDEVSCKVKNTRLKMKCTKTRQKNQTQCTTEKLNSLNSVESRFQCDICLKLFKFKSSKTHHKKQKLHTCKPLYLYRVGRKKIFDTPKFPQRSLSVTKMNCSRCLNVFSNSRKIDEHKCQWYDPKETVYLGDYHNSDSTLSTEEPEYYIPDLGQDCSKSQVENDFESLDVFDELFRLHELNEKQRNTDHSFHTGHNYILLVHTDHNYCKQSYA